MKMRDLNIIQIHLNCKIVNKLISDRFAYARDDVFCLIDILKHQGCSVKRCTPSYLSVVKANGNKVVKPFSVNFSGKKFELCRFNKAPTCLYSATLPTPRLPK